MIKGLIFDVDGVIINTENTHFIAYRDVFKEYGYELTLDGYKKHFSGRSIKGGVLSLLTETSFPDSQNQELFCRTIAEKKIFQTLKHFKKQVEYFDDTIKCIHKVSKGNCYIKGISRVVEKPVLAMATGLESVFVKFVLAHHNLRELFPIVITADQYSHSKPDPECYLIALQKMGLMATEVIGIEDSVSGVKALNNANIFSVAITNTNSAHELREAKVVTESLVELIEK